MTIRTLLYVILVVFSGSYSLLPRKPYAHMQSQGVRARANNEKAKIRPKVNVFMCSCVCVNKFMWSIVQALGKMQST